ncbi:hypothetical protein LINPERHAP2_LOCUS3671 [Linum perenne]
MTNIYLASILVVKFSTLLAAGGLIRDSGRVLTAYSECLGVCSITWAELRAVLIGLLMVWEKGY